METQGSTSDNRGITDRLKQDGREQIETRKRSAADSIAQVAQALNRAGEQLDGQPTLASYANQIAGNINTIADRIRDGSIEELIDDTRQIARRNPGLFILGSFAAGVALARFMKASERSRYTTGDDYTTDFTTASASQATYPSQEYSPGVSTSDQPYTQPNSPYTGGV